MRGRLDSQRAGRANAPFLRCRAAAAAHLDPPSFPLDTLAAPHRAPSWRPNTRGVGCAPTTSARTSHRIISFCGGSANGEQRRLQHAGLCDGDSSGDEVAGRRLLRAHLGLSGTVEIVVHPAPRRDPDFPADWHYGIAPRRAETQFLIQAVDRLREMGVGLAPTPNPSSGSPIPPRSQV